MFFGEFCEIFLNPYFFIEHLWTVASGFFSQLGNKQQNWKQLFRASYDAKPLNLIGWSSESSVKRIKPCLNYLKKTYQILRSNLFWSFFFFTFWFLVPYFLLHSEKLSKLASVKHDNQNQAFVSFTWPLKELLDRKIKLSPYDVNAFTWKFIMRTSFLRLPYNRILAQHLLWISSVNIKTMYRNRPTLLCLLQSFFLISYIVIVISFHFFRPRMIRVLQNSCFRYFLLSKTFNKILFLIIKLIWQISQMSGSLFVNIFFHNNKYNQKLSHF